MNAHARYAVFSLVSTVVYVLAYNFGWQAFRYYPLLNRVSLDPLPAKESGPAMMYYGWMATAAIAGLVVALIVPPKYAAKLPSAVAWVVPLLLVALVVGLVVSVFQAATQINETTLSFIPKLVGIFFAMIIAGPWMMSIMLDYMRQLFTGIPGMIE